MSNLPQCHLSLTIYALAGWKIPKRAALEVVGGAVCDGFVTYIPRMHALALVRSDLHWLPRLSRPLWPLQHESARSSHSFFLSTLIPPSVISVSSTIVILSVAWPPKFDWKGSMRSYPVRLLFRYFSFKVGLAFLQSRNSWVDSSSRSAGRPH